MLARVADMRASGRLRLKGRGGRARQGAEARSGPAARHAGDRRRHDRGRRARRVARASRSRPARVLIVERERCIREADAGGPVHRRLLGVSGACRRAAHRAGRGRTFRRPARLQADARASRGAPGGRRRSPASAARRWRPRACKSLFPIGDIAVMGILPVIARLPDALAAHPADGGGDRRGATRRARHHRQPRLHPSRRAPRAQGAARPADRRLCQPERLGLAAGTGEGDARLYRLRARRSCRSSPKRYRAARRPALRLCRPSADRAPRRIAAQRGRGAPPRRRAAAARRVCRARAGRRSAG